MLETKLVSSLDKVGADRDFLELDRQKPLYGYVGEEVSFQIAYRDTSLQKDERDVRRIVVSSAGEVQADVRVRQVLNVMCRRSCNPDSYDEDYLFYEAGMAPDLLKDLEPGETFEVTGDWRSLWVDVCPRQDAGQCCLTFALEEKNEISADASEKSVQASAGKGETGVLENGGARKAEELTVTVQVSGESLPKLNIPHTEWFHYDGIADYYGVEVFSEEFWRIFRNFLAVYIKRGCNTILTPVLTPPLDTEVGGERTTIQLVDVELAEGEYRLDLSKLERFLDVCLEAGIAYFEICHLFTQWGAAAAPKVVAMVNGREEKIFGWDTPSSDPEYLKFLTALLPQVKDLLSRRGLLQCSFFHISDEPDLNSEHYQTSQSTVRSLLKGCTIVEAVTDYKYYEKGLVDIPVCATDHIEPFLERRPEKLWCYYCCSQTKEVPNRFISMPSWRNRIYGVLLYWHHMDGFLHWGFNFYNSGLSRKKINPYETPDADNFFPAGDPFLVYPGKDGIPDESIRIMVQKEAIDDYRALCLLESRIGRDKVMELIRREAGMELSFRQYPREKEFILNLRACVDEMLSGG